MEQNLSLNHFKKLISSYTENKFDIIHEFAKDRFGLKDDIELKISFSDARTRSRGGYSIKKKKMYISLVLSRYVRAAYNQYKYNDTQAFKDFLYPEYKGFKHSKTIGEFLGYWTLALTALICHEVAHAVQFNRTHGSGASIDSGYEGAVIEAMNGKVHAGHGLDFQYIYRVLREEFVNQHINTEQESFIPPKIEDVVIEPQKEKREYTKKFLVSYDKHEKVYNYFTPEKDLIGRIYKNNGYHTVHPSYDKEMSPWIVASENLVDARKSLLNAFKIY